MIDNFYGSSEGCAKCRRNQAAMNKRGDCIHLNLRSRPYNLSSWAQWQTTRQPTFKVGHSSTSSTFCQLMDMIQTENDKSISEEGNICSIIQLLEWTKAEIRHIPINFINVPLTLFTTKIKIFNFFIYNKFWAC